MDELAAAHRALRADASVQFNLPGVKPPAQPPTWLKAFFKWLGDMLEPVGRAIRWLFSWLPDWAYGRIFLWIVLILALLGIAALLFERITSGEWRMPRLRRTARIAAVEEEEWIPDEQSARSWLEEADALAAQGSFAEAAHHLLFRSIEDIQRRRPQLVRPALTSREIGTANAIPETARQLFSDIALAVERSLFGGRTLGEREWLQARSSYDGFALAKSWRA
ncbi:MAG: DUF4129 domain-containing protein [Sphingomicrobium sp.]